MNIAPIRSFMPQRPSFQAQKPNNLTNEIKTTLETTYGYDKKNTEALLKVIANKLQGQDEAQSREIWEQYKEVMNVTSKFKHLAPDKQIVMSLKLAEKSMPTYDQLYDGTPECDKKMKKLQEGIAKIQQGVDEDLKTAAGGMKCSNENALALAGAICVITLKSSYDTKKLINACKF